MLRLLRRLRARIRYRNFDEDLRHELEVHRAFEEDARRLAGEDDRAAKAGAARQLGNVALAREDGRAVWIAPALESVLQDLRYALRSLRRQPRFTVPALAILFLAIGINVAVFTFLAVFMRPWPVGDPGSIVEVRPRNEPGFSPAEFEHLRAAAQSVSALAARSMQYARVRTSPGASGDHGPIEFVSANYFTTLQLPLTAGRDFAPDDDRPGAPAAVAIISEGYWERQFSRDPTAIGRTIAIDGEPVVIVGVAAAGFAGVTPAYRIDVWVPLSTMTLFGRYRVRAGAPPPCCLSLAGRLRDDDSASGVEAELDTLSRAFRRSRQMDGGGVIVRETGGLPGDLGTALTIVSALLAAPLAVLALACANVGNLQLARNLRRRAEIAMRLSLGASRTRITRQLLTEALLLAGLAGAGGLLIAQLLPTALPILIDLLDESDVFPFEQFVPDTRVVLFTIGVCTFACLIFGLAPALTITRLGATAIAEGRHGGGRGVARLRTILMGAQIALCTALLAVAGLLSRGIIEAVRVDPGFDTSHVYVATITLPSDEATEARTRAMLQALAVVPARSAVGAIGFVAIRPLSRGVPQAEIAVPGAATSLAESNRVSRSYFDVLGIPLVAGRWFDDRAASRQVVVNETFARTFWPSSSAVGRTFHDRKTEYEVAGVIRDTRQTRLDRVTPMYFAPIGSSQTLVVRSSAPDLDLRLTALARSIDGGARVQVSTLSAVIRQQLSDAVELAAMAWMIGLLALVLAAIGIFGVFAFLVEERRREIGIRLALGARRVEIRRALFESVRLASIGGLTTGVLVAVGAAGILRSQLFGVSPLDPLALGAVCLLLVGTAALATAIPTRRAARIDPAITLRDQ